jgi:hypothetical protein
MIYETIGQLSRALMTDISVWGCVFSTASSNSEIFFVMQPQEGKNRSSLPRYFHQTNKFLQQLTKDYELETM